MTGGPFSLTQMLLQKSDGVLGSMCRVAWGTGFIIQCLRFRAERPLFGVQWRDIMYVFLVLIALKVSAGICHTMVQVHFDLWPSCI